MAEQAFHDAPLDDLPPGHCVYQETWDDKPCGASATWHGVAANLDAGEACDKHHDILAFHSDWVHPWAAECVEARFVSTENRCYADPRVG